MITMLQDKTLWGLTLAVLLMMVGVGMIVAILPQRIVYLDGGQQSVGYLASAFAFSYMLFQLPLGSLSDKLGFKPFLVTGYLICFFAGLVFFFATDSRVIFFARFLQGIGEAPVWALAAALLSIKFPLHKGKALGIYNATIHFGLTLGPILGVALGKVLSVNQLFLIYAFSCLAGAIVTSLLVEPLAKKEIKTNSCLSFQHIFKVIKQPQASISLLGITLYGAGYGTFLTIIPAFLLQKKELTPIDLGFFFSLFYLAISISQIIIGPLSDRLDRKIFMIVGLLVAAGGIIITPALSGSLILLNLTLASLGMGVFYLASIGFCHEIVPNYLKGTISGIYYLFWGIGMFSVPPILASIAASIHFQASMAVYSFSLMLVAVGMIKQLSSKQDNVDA